jgi:type III secretion protein V
LLAMALVPGFPSLTFLALGGITAAGAAAIWMFDKRRRQERDEADAEQSRAQEAAQDPANLPVSRPGEAFTLRLAPDVMAGLERTRFNETANAEMAAIRHKLGLTLPIAGIVEDVNLANNAVEFDVAGAAAWRGTVQPDGRFEVPQNTGEPASGSYDTVMPGVGFGAWREGEAATAETADDGDAALALTPSEVLAKVTVFNIGRWAHHAFGLQAADEWLNGLAAAGHDGLVQQVRQSVSVSRIADIFRHLLAEGVSLAHARLVLEAILDLAPRLEDTKLIADHVRLALARPLSAQHASGDRTISAIVIELDLEEHLRGAVIEGPTGNRLSLEFDAADALETALRAWQEPAWRTDRPLVVITGFEVRRTVWQFAVSRNISVSVLAFEEIAPEYQIVPVGALNMSALQQPALHAPEPA